MIDSIIKFFYLCLFYRGLNKFSRSEYLEKGPCLSLFAFVCHVSCTCFFISLLHLNSHKMPNFSDALKALGDETAILHYVRKSSVTPPLMYCVTVNKAFCLYYNSFRDFLSLLERSTEVSTRPKLVHVCLVPPPPKLLNGYFQCRQIAGIFKCIPNCHQYELKLDVYHKTRQSSQLISPGRFPCFW